MSKIKLYIAATIDGYIAREDGSLDWLYALPNPNNIDYGYADFISTIDSVIIGKNTYEEILGFGTEWPYANCKSYIITSESTYQPKTENTIILNDISNKQVNDIKASSQKDIWIIGGGIVISEFLNLGQVDEMILCIIPSILGKGIRLFPNSPKETSFQLVASEAFETGAINLTYEKK